MKISKQKLMEIISEECGMAYIAPPVPMGGEIDEEGRMAKRQLSDIAEYSQELMAMLQDETQLEAWVQSKLTKAADYIRTVKHYVEYGMEEGAYDQVMPQSGIEMSKMDQESESFEYDPMEFDDNGGKF